MESDPSIWRLIQDLKSSLDNAGITKRTWLLIEEIENRIKMVDEAVDFGMEMPAWFAYIFLAVFIISPFGVWKILELLF